MKPETSESEIAGWLNIRFSDEDMCRSRVSNGGFRKAVACIPETSDGFCNGELIRKFNFINCIYSYIDWCILVLQEITPYTVQN